MEASANLALKALALYLEVGVGWALWFHMRGLRRVDPGIEGAGLLFRLLITPGLVALWPLVAARCLGKTGSREILGGSNSPISAHTLRSIHFRVAQLLLLVVPLVLGLAVTLRPSSSPYRVESPPGTPASLPDFVKSTIRNTPDVPGAVRLDASGAGEGEVTLGVLPGFSRNDLRPDWSDGDLGSEFACSEFLRGLPRAGEASCSIRPRAEAHPSGSGARLSARASLMQSQARTPSRWRR